MIHNFNAGPAILPPEVIKNAAEAVLNCNDSGLSILEISHRGKEFMAIMDEAMEVAKELYNVPDDYSILFLQGGASTQFLMVPYNLLPAGGSAAYVDTGSWANKAIKEAKLLGNVNVVASSAADNYSNIPKEFEVPSDSAYLHITSNNTIFGTQYPEYPECNIPLVVDMSSDIFSRPININQFSLIYAGAQKNLGPAGTTIIILKNELLGKSGRKIPSMLDYQIHADNGSMYNTPPVFSIYVSLLNMLWIKKNGGVDGMHQRNSKKADLLYEEIDRNPLIQGTAEARDRSMMNITFIVKNNTLDKEFHKLATEANLIGLKGHRSVGGFRASMYNAMEIESTQVLVDVLKFFGNKYG